MTNKENIKGKHSVVGTYTTMETAEMAVQLLGKDKFPINQVSIITTNLENEKDVVGFVTTGDVVKQGIKSGAWFGGFFGILVGMGFLWVPVVGPLFVAGPLAAMLVSGLEGSVAGATIVGLLSGLTGWGISKEHVIKYADDLSGGKFLVIAHGTFEEVQRAHAILKNIDKSELYLHADA